MELLVLDGNSILNRAFYGIKLLTTKEGLYTNGIYGFMTVLQKLEKEVQPDATAIAFDLNAPTFRHKRYAGYKANRHGMPEELAQQLPNLKKLLTLLGYRLVTCEGYEADDILGTLGAACTRRKDTCVIATGDRDSLQLVGPYVSVRLARTKYGQPQVTLYDEQRVMEEFGVTPPEMIEIKALQGDSSDCIPGVRGIGPKGAGQLIQQYHSIDYIYDHLKELDIRESMRQKLENGRESAYLSRELGTIRTDVPVGTDIQGYVRGPVQKQEATDLMRRLEFFKMLESLDLGDTVEQSNPAEPDTAVALVLHPDIEQLCSKLKADGHLYLAGIFEGRSLQRLSVVHKQAVFLLESPQEWDRVFALHLPCCTFDSKLLYLAVESSGAELLVETDALLAAYLLNPTAKSYSYAHLCQEYGIPLPSSVTPKGLQPQDLMRMDTLSACGQWQSLPQLCSVLEKNISEANQTTLLQNIEQPLARILAHMEQAGFAVDAKRIAAYGDVLAQKADALQKQIWEEVGYEFNLNSPKQLGEALFVKLGLPHGKKTKSGWSTSAAVLENLRYDNPVVELVLQYRTVSKLKSTYCDGLLKVIAPDERIHSSFNQTETRTGRISSTEPNLQNIPVRTDIGRELRRFFVAKPGCVLIDADYSQIELRVLAHTANDKNMIDAFRSGEDIHRATAAQVFHMPEEMVTPLMRSRAKAVNFGIVYGIGAFSLSKQLHITRQEADAYIRDYLQHYSGINDYMQRMVEEAKQKGYAETIFGRRRYLPELKSSNFNLRSFGERVARNMPIQGAAADIIKIAMIHVENRLHREGLSSQLILQVHDELIVEAPEAEAETAKALLQEEMENAAQLSVPLVADAKIGKTWYEAKA
ncbi:MAG: DNA polymerase I [Oscillospiraceae bacterium]|nr:DNA polymerase I [Oscillospiraceae bacterium]